MKSYRDLDIYTDAYKLAISVHKMRRKPFTPEYDQ